MRGDDLTAAGLVDGHETVNLTISNPGGGLALSAQTTATPWIANADGPSIVCAAGALSVTTTPAAKGPVEAG